jgi:hypothetical protein
MHQYMFWPEGKVGDAKDLMPLQRSAEFERTSCVHELIDAISAAIADAQAGLNWLNAEPTNREEVRKSLNHVIKDGKRAAEIVVQLRALINEMPED